MPNLNLTEFSAFRFENGGAVPAMAMPPILTQSLPFTATSSVSAVFSNATSVIRVVSDVDCYIEVGSAPTAVTLTSMRLAAGKPEPFLIQTLNLRLAVVA